MKTSRILLPLVLAVAAPLCAQESKPLRPGDPAPELKASQWMQGEPIAKLERGQPYVVEFWATWCGPCKTSIPHLSELAKKFDGKVKFVGMSVWERDKEDAVRFKKINEFITQMAGKMSYRVAADTSDGFMATQWMKAAGERGIPSAFIVDGEGRVAWIGHPMNAEFETALDQVVQAKWDVQAFAERRDKERAAEAAQQSAMAGVQKLAREGKSAEALAALDKVIAEQPELASRTSLYRLNLLAQADPAAVSVEVRRLADGEHKNDWRMLGSLARIVAGPQAKQSGYALGIDLLTRALAAGGEEQPTLHSQLADFRARQGDAAGAAAAQEKAIAAAEKTANFPPQAKESYQRKLEEYRTKAPGTGSAPPAK